MSKPLIVAQLGLVSHVKTIKTKSDVPDNIITRLLYIVGNEQKEKWDPQEPQTYFPRKAKQNESCLIHHDKSSQKRFLKILNLLETKFTIQLKPLEKRVWVVIDVAD